MFNTTIPISRLLAGSLSFLWIIQLFLLTSNQSMTDFLDVMLEYKDLSIYLTFVFIILSYPLGIVINYFSYHFTDKVLYKTLIFNKKKYDSKSHKARVDVLFINSTDKLNDFFKEKTQELSILGSSAFNFLIISSLLIISRKSFIYFLFTSIITLTFFSMVIWKYRSWYNTVEKNFNIVEDNHAEEN